MHARMIAWLAAASVASVLPAQEPFAGHKIRPPEGSQVAVVNNTEDWTARDWAIDARNPVPTRIESSHFGELVNTGTGMWLQCYVGDDVSCVRVSGGQPDANVVLFCSLEKSWIEFPFGVFLLSPDCVQVPGVFDDQGLFDLGVDLARHELCGCTYHFQALEIVPPRVRDYRYNPIGHIRETPILTERKLMLSEGLSLTYHHGNPQPPLEHIVPPLTATLHMDVGTFIPTLYNVLLQFEAAESYQVVVDHETSVGDKTQVFVRLKSPGGPKGEVTTLRKVVDLGLFPQPFIEIWVGMDHSVVVDEPLFRPVAGEHAAYPTPFEDFARGEGGCRCYGLAAVIETLY